MTLVPVAEAQSRLFAMAPRVGHETVTLREAAGRWAAEDVLARRTQPAADLSAMDGYAIRYADLPGPWTVIGESAAGRPFTSQVATGQATRIFTGAAMPEGADTVMVQEEAERDGTTLILAGEGPPTLGRNTRRKGLDFSTGTRLIAAGDRLSPARIAVAATGDELVPPGSTTDGVALPESNGIMLAAMLADMPVDIIDLGILPDNLEVLREAFASVEADLLVTTGGASVGDHDLVRPAIEAAGGTIDFWRIALRPGKPMMAGRIGEMMVLGLPGNPVSAFVTATLFVKPVVAHMAGARDPLPQSTHALLGEDLPANNARTDYLRAELRDGKAYASTIQDSSMLLTLARSTCLIVRPGNAPVAKTGESAEILVIA